MEGRDRSREGVGGRSSQERAKTRRLRVRMER